MRILFKEGSKMNIRNVLNDEIKNEFEELKKIELGSDKYKTTVDGLAKLVDKSIDLERLDFEMDDRAENRETENDLKLQQMKEDKKDRIAKNVISVVGIAVPVVFGVWGTYKTFKFEENGTITSDAGRKYINNIFRFLK